MTESELQGCILQLADLLAYRTYHVTNVHRRLRSHSSVGFPDLVIANPRHLLVRELKSERGRLTDAQNEWLAVLAASGVDAGVWRPRDWHDGTIERTLLHWRA